MSGRILAAIPCRLQGARYVRPKLRDRDLTVRDPLYLDAPLERDGADFGQPLRYCWWANRKRAREYRHTADDLDCPLNRFLGHGGSIVGIA